MPDESINCMTFKKAKKELLFYLIEKMGVDLQTIKNTKSFDQYTHIRVNTHQYNLNRLLNDGAADIIIASIKSKLIFWEAKIGRNKNYSRSSHEKVYHLSQNLMFWEELKQKFLPDQ
jgi:hypothetical protein